MSNLRTMKRWNEVRLPADERPKVLYEYWVTGRGAFPFDMLRYDSAWPSSSTDVANLEWQIGQQLRSVKLMSHSKPTVDRWMSFMWSVSDRTNEV